MLHVYRKDEGATRLTKANRRMQGSQLDLIKRKSIFIARLK